MNYGLAIFLLANKLFNEIDESAQDMNLKVYQEAMVQYREYGGTLTINNLNLIAQYEKTEQLIINIDNIRHKAKVNGRVYTKWLSEGGSVEVIFGLIASGDTNTSRNMIDKKSDYYMREWEAYETYYRVNEGNKLFDNFKDFVSASFFSLMDTFDDSETDYINAHPKYMENVKELLGREINAIRSDDMEKVYDVALRVIGKCRFYYTSSYNILADIQEASKVNPDTDVREAALLATINYIADYLADQMTFAK